MTREEMIQFVTTLYQIAESDCRLEPEDEEKFNKVIESLTEPSGDLISRKVALDSLEELDWDTAYERSQVEEMLKALPPVTPVRRKGEWETGYTYPDGVYWKCSVCEELIRVRIPMHFCSNCGSKMIRKRKKNEDKKLQV